MITDQFQHIQKSRKNSVKVKIKVEKPSKCINKNFPVETPLTWQTHNKAQNRGQKMKPNKKERYTTKRLITKMLQIKPFSACFQNLVELFFLEKCTK